MEPEFYQDYKNLSIPELVKVAKSPRDYLPEAVTAAERVLRERGVPEEEIAAEEWKLAQKEMSDAASKRRFSDYFDWMREIFNIDHQEGLAERRFKIFIVLYSLWYLFAMYATIKEVVFLMRCTVCDHATRALGWGLTYIIYLTLGLFFVMKQKKLGWALVFIQQVVLIAMAMWIFFGMYEKHRLYLDILMWPQLLAFCINVGIAVFLWRPYMREFFKVTEKVRTTAVLTGIGLAVVAVAVM